MKEKVKGRTMTNKTILKQGKTNQNPAFFSCFTKGDTLLFFSIGREISLPFFIVKFLKKVYDKIVWKSKLKKQKMD